MRYKILIVDDEKSIRDTLLDILWHEGFDADQASNGFKCLKKLKKKDFDVVVLDVKMSSLDGVQTLKQIKKKYNIPVIMISGHADNHTASETIKLGAFDFLSKPFGLDKFLEVINKACYTQQQPQKSDEEKIAILEDEVHCLKVKLSLAKNNVEHCASKIAILEQKIEQIIAGQNNPTTNSEHLILQKNQVHLDKNQLKRDISQGKTLLVIKNLIEILSGKQSDLVNNLFILQTELVRLIKKMGMNVLSEEEKNRQMNDINHRILKIIDVI